eukprot:COSAG04_NODE_33540_length_142_cov_36.441860_1_plen_26_part_01
MKPKASSSVDGCAGGRGEGQAGGGER